MVIGLLVLASIPTVTGVAQGISAKKQNAKLKEKINFNMTATLSVEVNLQPLHGTVGACFMLSSHQTPFPSRAECSRTRQGMMTDRSNRQDRKTVAWVASP
jgi:hypothetical protein